MVQKFWSSTGSVSHFFCLVKTSLIRNVAIHLIEYWRAMEWFPFFKQGGNQIQYIWLWASDCELQMPELVGVIWTKCGSFLTWSLCLDLRIEYSFHFNWVQFPFFLSTISIFIEDRFRFFLRTVSVLLRTVSVFIEDSFHFNFLSRIVVSWSFMSYISISWEIIRRVIRIIKPFSIIRPFSRATYGSPYTYRSTNHCSINRSEVTR